MKLCPTCQNKYPDDANFCPREECASAEGPRRLVAAEELPPARFVLISKLGGGQSGEVWQASDAQTGAAVAYKVVMSEVLPTAAAFERAQRELRQLQRTSSPRIVKVVEFGKTPEGRLFVASELASGEPLDQVMGRLGVMPLERAKKIAAQIGEALLEAQKVGVVHRDLAAKNILVSGDDDVRVINFPIPRPCTESLFGVPEYMSPEQAEGKLIDQRSNTYSLGALLYLMLTGQPPHRGATPQATLEAALKGDITPPSIKRGGGLTPEVDRILLKALERNSSRRPLTMRQFLNDVSGLISPETQTTVSAGGVGPRDAAFARTMMFAGSPSDVQKLVAQAVAARQAAGNGAPEPVPAVAAAPPPSRPATPPPLPASRAGTPPPVASPAREAPALEVPAPEDGDHGTPGALLAGNRPSHGAAVAATMIAMPAATGVPASAMAKIDATPPPPSSGVRTPPLDASKAPGADAAGSFRETLWFKKGDVDQMVADARAKVAAMANAKKAAAAESEIPTDDVKPLEDRYVDDGTVTVEDREKFSLGSGKTSAPRSGKIPGERMSENEMLDEIGGGKRIVIIGIVVAVVVALVAVVAVSTRGKSKDKDKTDQVSTVKPPEPKVPSPEPAGEGAAAPAAKMVVPEAPAAVAPPVQAAAPAAVEEKPEPASKPPVAARKKVPAKKKVVAVKKRK